MRYSAVAALAFGCATAALPAAAQETTKRLTYAAFEPSVTHLDLETCPEALAHEGAFCRLSIGSDMVHVWVFEEQGDQALVEVRSYGPDEFSLTLK